MNTIAPGCQTLEVKTFHRLVTGALKPENVITLLNADVVIDAGSYQKVKNGKTVSFPIVRSNTSEKDTKRITNIALAYGVIMFNGLPADINAYDTLMAEEAELLHIYETTCRKFNKKLLSIRKGKRKFNFACLEDKYIDIKNSIPQINELFKEEHPEVAEAIKFIQTHFLFKKHIPRKERLHTPAQPLYTSTGRCQYSYSHLYDGPLLCFAKRYRSIIYNPNTVYEVDLKAADMGFAAALSKDEAMAEDYLREDIYNHFIADAGLSITREQAKIILLGITKGLTPYGIAKCAGIGLAEAEEIYNILLKRYHTYQRWAMEQAGVLYDTNTGRIRGVNTKKIITAPLNLNNKESIALCDYNERINSAKSFLVQAYGSVLLHGGVVDAIKAGVKVIATLHDSVYVESREDAIKVRDIIEKNSQYLLNGFRLETTMEPVNQRGEP